MVERPLVRFDETFTVARDMKFSCHPLYIKDGFLHWVCDNYLVGGDEPERLHAFPERVTELRLGRGQVSAARGVAGAKTPWLGARSRSRS